MESYWEDITPAKAAEYLRRNAVNRSISKNTADGYARDMAAGRWHPTHQGLAFDEDGYLRDGQHRLTAVVRANVTVRFWVTRGVSPDSFSAMDIGRGRTMADLLHIEGHDKHASQLAAVGRRATTWLAGYPWSRGYNPTRGEISITLNDYPALEDAAQYAHGWRGRQTLAPALAGFCWWLLISSKAEDADGDSFMSSLRTGENLEHGDPAYALRERLIGDRGSARVSRASYAVGQQRQEVHLALTIMAWNQHVQRKRISKIILPPTMSDETFPRPIGLPASMRGTHQRHLARK